jgi:SAM-dependent methyltransferase
MEDREFVRMALLEDVFWWYRGLRRIVRTLLEPHLPERRPLRILDAGCGTGGFLREIRDLGLACGVDVSEQALRLARQRGLTGLARASVEALPVATASQDVVVSLDVLYHRGVRSEERALAELVRCLRPGGLLLLNLPAYEWLRSAHDEAIHTARRYTRSRVRRLLEAHPLRILKLSHWNTLLLPLAVLVRLLRRGSGESDSDVRPLPGWLNTALEQFPYLEARWLRRGSLPAGLSVVALARKEGGAP